MSVKSVGYGRLYPVRPGPTPMKIRAPGRLFAPGPGFVTVTALPRDHRHGAGTGGINGAHQEAGESVPGCVQRRRQGRLMAGIIVLTVGAGPIVAKCAQTADVPTHLDFVLATHPDQLLRDVRGPVPLAALVHFALV